MELGAVLRVVRYAEAWRVWCVQETRRGLRIASVIHEAQWPAGTDLVATCPEHRHVAPDLGCTCGIHAVRDAAAVWSYLRGRDESRTVARILGRVALSGRVIEHEHGWRGERAYPLEFVTGDLVLAARLSCLVDARRLGRGHARERRRVGLGDP